MCYKIEGLSGGAWTAVSISKGTKILFCDGSYQPNMDDNVGVLVWEVSFKKTYRYTWRFLPKTSQVGKFYKSSFKVIYAILSIISSVCQIYQLQKGEINLGYNNL